MMDIPSYYMGEETCNLTNIINAKVCEYECCLLLLNAKTTARISMKFSSQTVYNQE